MVNVGEGLKKYFVWTQRDLAQWEALRSKGPLHFVVKYGLAFSGIFFIFLGGLPFITRLVFSILGGTYSLQFLLYQVLQLLLTALLCLLAGLVNSLATWWLEEKLYWKYKANYPVDQE